MAGLISKNMQQEQQETPQQPDPNLPSPVAEGGLSGEPDDPQLDIDIEKVKLAGMAMLYDDKGFESASQELAAGADDPAQAVAILTFNLMKTLDEKSGGQIPESALIPAAVGLMEEVLTIGEATGVITADENTAAQSIQRLIALAIEAGIIDPAAIEELMADMPEEEIRQLVAQQEQIAGVQPAAGGV